MESAPSGVEYFPAVQLRQPDSKDRLVTLLHLPDAHGLHLNCPSSSWYSPGSHGSHVVVTLGLVVMRPAGQLVHWKEPPFAVIIIFAVEELKNVPGKQQKDRPLLPMKAGLLMAAPAQIRLHQVWLNLEACSNTAGERIRREQRKESER